MAIYLAAKSETPQADAITNATSAAIILAEAKASLPHGSYLPWLEKHGIEPRTAQRLVLEHKQPAKAEERREKHKTRERETRAKAKSATCGAFDQPTTQPETKGNADAERNVDVEDQRKALLAYIETAPASRTGTRDDG